MQFTLADAYRNVYDDDYMCALLGWLYARPTTQLPLFMPFFYDVLIRKGYGLTWTRTMWKSRRPRARVLEK